MKRLTYIIAFLFLTLISYGGTAEKNKILVLNSYNSAYKFGADVSEGIYAALSGSKNDIYFENIFVKKDKLKENYDIFQKLYINKYGSEKFDVIILCGESAVEFYLYKGEEIFENTPVVYCGVYYIPEAVKNKKNMVGTKENVDIYGTIEGILKIYPKTKNIAVYRENGKTGILFSKLLKEARNKLNAKVRITEYINLNTEEMKNSVNALSEEAVPVVISIAKDKSRKNYEQFKLIEELTENVKKPVFSVWDDFVQAGIAGGKMVSSFSHGFETGMIAERILSGEETGSMEIEKEDNSRFIFNQTVLNKYNIPKEMLPEGSTIINKVEAKKQVLILNSYGQDFEWTEKINDTIKKKIQNEVKDVDLYVEFFDTKKFGGIEYNKILDRLINYKYANIKFDAIITTDDFAFEFALSKKEWTSVDKIFCGVNSYRENEGRKEFNYTGVVEDIDIFSTLNVIWMTKPEVKKIHVINDRTITGIKNKEKFDEAVKMLKKKEVEFIYYDNKTFEEMISEMSKLKKNDAVFLLTFMTDKNNKNFSYDHVVKSISENTKAPIYSVWDFYLGYGIVGGMITVPEMQGEVAGELALKVLKGEKASSIPVLMKSPNKYIFDYKELKKKDIKKESLPEGSTVLNEPVDIMGNNKKIAATVILFIFIMAVAAVIYFNNSRIRKKTQNELKKQLVFWQSIMDCIPNPIFYKDKELKYVFCNKSFEEYVGRPKEQIIGKKVDDVLTVDVTEKYIQADKDVIAKKSSITIEAKIRKRDGGLGDVLVTKGAILDRDGGFDGIIGVMADISERMKMEENLRNLNKTKDRIFSIIGHDLRGPIGNILTVMDYFETENAMDEKERQRMVSIVKRTANSALYLLENLLFWAKMQTGDLSFEVKKINLREMIIPTVALYRVPLSEKKIKIDYHVDPSIMVFGDEQSIKTIIRNMLSNAVKYTPEGGEIRIDVVEALDKVEISVIDSGNGISQENIKRILESTETFTTRGTNGEKGTGLGLRICKEFIEKNGGELKIESEEGIGSRFYFTMKRADILH